MSPHGPLRLLARVVVAELRQHLRDPLTLVFMVVVPLFLYPVLGMMGNRLVQTALAEADAQVLAVAVEPAIELPDNLRAVPADDLAEAVRSGKVMAAARVTAAGNGADVWWDSRSPDSLDARGRLGDALREHRKDTQIRRVDAEDTMTEADRLREMAARILPALLLFTLLSGGLYTALDIITGEKERGTLETLLSTAVDRRVVMGGKFVVVLCFTGLTALFSVLSSWASAKWAMGLELPMGTALIALALFLPMAVLLSAILCVAAAWAQDFKSGQVLTTPLLVMPLAMAAVSLLPGFALTPASALVPIAGLALATREVLAGRGEPVTVGLAFVATCGWAALTLAAGARMMGREDVVMGTRGSGQRRLRGDYRLDAVGVWAVAFLLMWFLGQTAQSVEIRWGMVFTQLGLLAPLAFLAPWWLGLPIRETLRWSPASPREWTRALVVGLCMPAIGLGAHWVQSLILTTPTTFFAGVLPEDAPLWQLVVCFAVLPGLCEEVLFRGAFFGLWRTRASPWMACIVTAIAFGMFHLSIFRFFSTGVLGLVLGVISMRSRSVLPGMLAHALNNAFFMVAMAYGWDVQPSWWMLLPIGVAVAALVVPGTTVRSAQPGL